MNGLLWAVKSRLCSGSGHKILFVRGTVVHASGLLEAVTERRCSGSGRKTLLVRRGAILLAVEHALFGQLETLQWLRSQDPPFPWSEDVCEKAAVAQVAKSTCPWVPVPTVPLPSCRGGRIRSSGVASAWPLDRDIRRLRSWAEEDEGLPALRWLRAQNPPFELEWNADDVCIAAAQGDDRSGSELKPQFVHGTKKRASEPPRLPGIPVPMIFMYADPTLSMEQGTTP